MEKTMTQALKRLLPVMQFWSAWVASATGTLLLGIKVSVENIFICMADEILTRGSCAFSALAWQGLWIRLLSSFKTTEKEELKPVQAVFAIWRVRWERRGLTFYVLWSWPIASNSSCTRVPPLETHCVHREWKTLATKREWDTVLWTGLIFCKLCSFVSLWSGGGSLFVCLGPLSYSH